MDLAGFLNGSRSFGPRTPSLLGPSLAASYRLLVLLTAARKAVDLTQKQLAAQSGEGVKLRAIQLYEQNQLDLRHSSVSSALALAKTLDCSIEDLAWQPIALEYDAGAFSSIM